MKLFKKVSDNWSDLALCAALWYAFAGFFVYLASKDNTIPMWGLGVLWLASPLIFGAFGIVIFAIGVFGFFILAKSEPFLNKYTDLLANYEAKSKNASRNGEKWKALGWKIVWVVVAAPLLFFLISFAIQDR